MDLPMHLNTMISPLFSSYSIMWVLCFYKIQNKVLYTDKTTEMGYTIDRSVLHILAPCFSPDFTYYWADPNSTQPKRLHLLKLGWVQNSSQVPPQPAPSENKGRWQGHKKNNDSCLPPCVCTYLTSTNSLCIPSWGLFLRSKR